MRMCLAKNKHVLYIEYVGNVYITIIFESIFLR